MNWQMFVHTLTTERGDSESTEHPQVTANVNTTVYHTDMIPFKYRSNTKR
jgi:hypothetical protein